MLSANSADPVLGMDPGRQLLACGQQLRASDLNCVSGTLREVATLAGDGPCHHLDQWRQAAERLSALRAEIAAAWAQTCGAGRPPLGDAELWAAIDAAMQRAARRLLSLIVQEAPAVDWAAGEPDGAGHAGLGIRLR